VNRSVPSRPYTVGLLFGGQSVEHEVSLVSARGIAAGFDEEIITCLPMAVTPQGAWLSPERSASILAGDESTVPELPAVNSDGRVLISPEGGGLVLSCPGSPVRKLELDAVFPIIHGYGGEDGRIQALLELAGVPCVGSGVAGSAVSMDKAMAKGVVAAGGLAVTPGTLVTLNEVRADRAAVLGRLAGEPGFPMFVKPASGGSSVGISRVEDARNLESALDEALGHDHRLVVETALDAREIEVAVLGGNSPRAAMPGEVVPGANFYTYEDKYQDGVAKCLIPADLPGELLESVRSMAIRAFELLDLHGMARVDFLIDKRSSKIWFNEVNTVPGFTPISMYPKMWEASGLPFPELLTCLVELALEQHSG
jgi:D-alanine-D-alanine ligase